MEYSTLLEENAALREELKRYKLVLDHAESPLFDWNTITNRIEFSDTWQEVFGYPSPDGSIHAFLSPDYLDPADIPLLLESAERIGKGSNYEIIEARIRTAQGRYRWCRFRASAIREEDGRLVRVVGIITNIDAEKAAKLELKEKAERDALTGLLNKETGRRQAEEYLSRQQGEAPCALLILDLDNFKYVNDRYGHLFGDAVINRVAREISSQFKPQDIQCRIGGDEFMVLVRGTNERALLERHCGRLRDALAHAFSHMHVDVHVSCSIGIALCPEHGTGYVELFSRADRALYKAKEMGKNNFCFYQDHMPQPAKADAAGHMNTPIDSDMPSLGNNDIAHRVFRTLYLATDLSVAIEQVIALMGTVTNVSRVYIFENSEDNLSCSNTFEWCNEGISPEIGNLQNICYETDLPGFLNGFNENGIFYCPDVSKAPKGVYDIVAPQGILSMLQCAIRENGVFRGYIGFDECQKNRYWMQEEIDVLTYCAEILSVFIMKLRSK